MIIIDTKKQQNSHISEPTLAILFVYLFIDYNYFYWFSERERETIHILLFYLEKKWNN